ncbi:MalY/PatB family protein [Microbacterium sp.]|uniref:MalY/PatB family protein n=1 Tax=Microbacterium sp. TaxID=51671 RepID=UPI0035B3056C
MTSPTSAEPMSTLRRRTSAKWRTYPEDVLPMFVAEMDYPLAPAIAAALHEAVDLGDTGYIVDRDERAARAFSEFAAARWGWTPDVRRMRTTTDVSVVIAEALRRLVRPGGGVIITPPVYPPFYDLIPEAGGSVVEVPLRDDGTAFSLDIDGIDRALEAGASGVLLCSPHNPVGLVHDRETLERLAAVVARHDGFVLADEIHAPLTHDGVAFTPYLSVSDEARSHGISAESGSKAFNLAGLKTAFFVTESDGMADLVRGLPDEVTYRTGQFGLIATREGFANGRDWLDGTIASLQANLDLLERELAEQLPAVRLRRPSAGFLAWLDMSALGWGDDPAVVARREARVALMSGPAFGRPGIGHARMNIACAPETITEAVRRLAAVRR